MHRTTPPTTAWTATLHTWERQRRAPATRRYLRRLRAEDQRFAAHREPDEIVDTAARYDTNGITLAAALLEHAIDPVAAAMFFEAARPRVAHLARQARGYAHQTRCPELVDPERTASWEAPDVIDANVISWTHEWIATHAGITVAHPIRSLRDWVRDQLRAAATRAIRIEHATALLVEDPAATEDARPPATPGDRLYHLLVAARDRGLITPDHAALVFDTRVGMANLTDAATTRGIAHDTARRWRRYAEAQLHALAHDPALAELAEATVA